MRLISLPLITMVTMVTMPKPVVEVLTRLVEAEQARSDFDACCWEKSCARDDMVGSMRW